ncbi:hypothetical protein QNA08_13950 [Chelatococcus sp. SYSU_G07232]|uniref:Uncharacterized protein n=1 Tax=Chelatococcus albus TaxID=3047466 RepID=A0ABT7AKH4_9HYPH|nr:hypothetical protein [Chelatococcus sp. SYSU_G07232]MDJ1159339.1 hypothetical protein [Chelatococcus sp. SYSU_G07232]
MATTSASRPPPAANDLRSAIRRARLEDAGRTDVVTDLRAAELARLEELAERLDPVFAAVPGDIDLFDHGIVPGERPRLYVDLLAFVEMERDRHGYRLLVDTRHGRQLMAASDDPEVIVAAVTDYVARRLVEREKALAAGRRAQVARGSRPHPAAGADPDHRYGEGDMLFATVMGALAGAAAFYAAVWWRLLP